jgi:hypothetical protein
MKIRKILTNSVLAALLCGPVFATAAPASENSIKELLAVTQAQNLFEGMRAQFDALMGNGIQQQLKGKTPNAKQQAAIDNMRKKMVALMQGNLAWEKLESMYLRIYRDSFSEEEVAGMLAFYKTPAGQAVVYKMPVMMQKVMAEVQNMMSGSAPQMQKIMEEFGAEMKAAGE